MKRNYAFLCCLAMSLIFFSAGCKKKVKPLSERIAKAWTAEAVKHNTTSVYVRGGSGNSVPGYSNFRLNLTGASNAVTYTEWDNKTFAGTWELQGDSKLILKGLNPEPSGTGGTVEFNIISIDDSKLVIKNVNPSKKTGDTINEYTLTNP
jgi:hypothetical protein